MSWLDALRSRALYHDEQAVIVQDDALNVLREIPDSSVDLILADPPYSSGGQFRGDRAQSTAQKYVASDSKTQEVEDFAGDVRDQRAYFAWSSLWLSEAWRVLRPGRACVVFSDWRQLPTTTDAIQAGGFVWRGVLVWDKVAGRPSLGISNGATEYATWGTRGPTDLGHDVYLQNPLRVSIPHSERGLHQTPKPVELLCKLVTLAPVGGMVVDPFTGSGSVCVAARRMGRASLGVELSPTHAATAAKRLQNEAMQLTLDA